MADEPTKSTTRRSGAAAPDSAPAEPTQADKEAVAPATSEKTAPDSDAQKANTKVEAGAEKATRALAGQAPEGRNPLRDQEISEAARNPEPLVAVEAMPEGTNAPDYSADNTNALRSSATPIDHPGVRTRDAQNQDRLALAAGHHSIPGQGHLALVDDDGKAVTFDDVFPDYTEGSVAVSAMRVNERFTQPNVKARNYSTRLLFAAGQRVDAFTANRFRLAVGEEAAAAASVAEPTPAVTPVDPAASA